MQPEVCAVQVAILIHEAYARSSHSCHCIILPLSTGSHSSFSARLVYMLKMLFDRDTNKCFNKDITQYLAKYHNKQINKYKAKLINKHKNKHIDKYKTKYLQPLPQQAYPGRCQ